MKLNAEQQRELCKKITQLLETEDWVLGFTTTLEPQRGLHILAGISPPKKIVFILNGIERSRFQLVDKARENFP